MSSPEPTGSTEAAAPEPTNGSRIAPPQTEGPGSGGAADGARKKQRSPWIWVSAALAVIAVGLLVWGISTRSDLDSTEDEVASLQSQVDQNEETGSTFVAAAKDAYESVKTQLGITNDDLQATEQELSEAEEAAAKAEKDAAAAKQDVDQAAGEAEEAKAQASEAQAEAEAAGAKAKVAADCAKSVVGAFGKLFEGSDVRAQAEAVRNDMQQIAAGCKTALSGS